MSTAQGVPLPDSELRHFVSRGFGLLLKADKGVRIKADKGDATL